MEPPNTGPDEAGAGDTLPDDLDVTRAVGLIQFPDVRRRRVAAAILFVAALGSAAGYASTSNGGLLAAAIACAVLGIHHFVTAWPLRIDQTEALATASRAVGFPVGHASARVMFRGLASKPVWQVLLYSADDPPSIRGLVELDAVDGRVLGDYTEHNPEDWSKFGLTT